MVPVESSFEVEFAQYFVDQSRKFLKPIIVYEIGDGGNRPDFILLDTPCILRGLGHTNRAVSGCQERANRRLRSEVSDACVLGCQ